MSNTQGRPKGLWACSYLIVPPQSAKRLAALKRILGAENLLAEGTGRIWAGRLVAERRITRILIVTDSPDPARDANRRIEAELSRLEAEFTVTTPLEIVDEPEVIAEPVASTANGNGNGPCMGV